MVMSLPASAAAGVYVNEKGFVVEDAGLTTPAPFSVIRTPVAMPPKLLPDIVTGAIAHVLPRVLLKVTVGGFRHPHDTWKRPR